MPEYHRIYLRGTVNDDQVTAYLPLVDGRFDADGPRPFLLKALWSGDGYYGELKFEGGQHHHVGLRPRLTN